MQQTLRKTDRHICVSCRNVWKLAAHIQMP